VTEDDGMGKPREMTAKRIYFAMLCSSPVLGIFFYLGRPDQGFGAWASAGVAVLVASNSWEMRRHLAFWVAAALVVIIQIPIVVLVPWGAKGINGRALFPLAILNGALSYGLLRLADWFISAKSKAVSRD